MHPSEIVKGIDFDAVGSTNLKTLDFGNAILKEKLSFMIYADLIQNTVGSNLEHSEFHHPLMVSHKEGYSFERRLYYTVKYKGKNYSLSFLNPRCFEFEERTADTAFLYNTSVYREIKDSDTLEDVSMFDATQTFKKHSEQKRIEELLDLFHREGAPYDLFKIGSSFKPQKILAPLPTLAVDIREFERFQRELSRWSKACFPRHFIRHDLKTKPQYYTQSPIFFPEYDDPVERSIELPSPVFYKPLGSMAYDIREYRSLPQIRFQRLFLNPDGCGLREALVPTVCIQEKNGDQYYLMTGLPNMNRMPLWNVKRIMSPDTETVVLCGCIQDAEALQRANEDVNNVAFTSYIGDYLEQIDFSPLAEKRVVFLISNYNDISLAAAYEEVAIIHEYLSEIIMPNLKIAEFAFVQRQVQYPDNSAIATPKDLASAYYYHHPKVDPESLIPPMNESEFRTMLSESRNSHEPFWKPSASVPQTPKSRVDNFIVRGFLYKGETTLLAGKSGSKKTHFALVLGRYVVAGDIPFLSDRFWTRSQPKGFPKKVVYWCFDDVSEGEINQQGALYKKDLSKEFADNLFIELAPATLIGNFETKALKKALEGYNYKGFPGLPVSLLIIDHLTALKGEDNRAEALSILSKFKREAMPNLAILVLHHCGQRGILSKTGVTMGPRINVTMKKNGNVFELAYDDSTNISIADVEKEPFSFVYDGLGVKVHEPKYNSEEMFKLIANYYKNEDYMQYNDNEIGILMGFCGKTAGDKRKGKKKKKAGPDSPTTADDGQNLDSQSKDEEPAQESSEPHAEQK